MIKRRRRKSIVFVDDDPDDAFLLAKAVRNSDLNVDFVHVSSGAELFENGLATTADLIILDINMPNENGFEVLELIKDRPALVETAVIMLTTSTHPEDRVRAQKLGALDIFAKASSKAEMDELIEKIRGLL